MLAVGKCSPVAFPGENREVWPEMSDKLASSLQVIDYKYSMAVGGVSCEPFSGPNSLLTGKNTGKFANSVTEVCRGRVSMILNTREF
jgi:hypothetical protein